LSKDFLTSTASMLGKLANYLLWEDAEFLIQSQPFFRCDSIPESLDRFVNMQFSHTNLIARMEACKNCFRQTPRIVEVKE